MTAVASPLEVSSPPGPEARFAERVRGLVESRYGYAPKDAAMPSFQASLEQHRAGRAMEAYWQLLLRSGSAGAGNDLQELVELLLNHDTTCGRTPPHFDVMRERILPESVRKGRPLRIASLGCSTGEEAYTLALTALEVAGPHARPAVEIVGLDLSARALTVARAGVYPASSLRDLTPARRELGFTRSPGGFQVRPELSRLVRFIQHNLMSPLPLVGIDAIFCQNVLIYFSPSSANVVLGHIRNALAPGGWLFLGPTESAHRQREWFLPVAFAETLAYSRR
ncbi:MAG: protein-glutamate O-methyltransferase CheR [Verrucomicrobia bacterium]|nr:protein-glutamate O-methyltransferase CheR [Verrucomicrobiota bacterium]